MCILFSVLQPQNSFEIETYDCTFDAGYFGNSGKCILKSVDGKNKFFSGSSDLLKPIDELKVSLYIHILLQQLSIKYIHILRSFMQMVQFDMVNRD